MSSFRIAIAQIAISADARENGTVIRQLINDAADAGARLIQFPEGALSGYAKSQITDWDDVNWDVVHDELHQVLAVAAERRIWVVLGSAHPLTPPNWPHNSLYVISDQGQIVDRYDKRFCSNTEITRFYSPGFEPTVFEVDGFRFGCMICVEVNFPDLFSDYERRGIDVLLFSAYPIDSMLELKARAYAGINCYWVALSAPTQTAHLMSSELIGPDGSVLAQVTGESGLVIGEIDRTDPQFHIPLNAARPWRTQAIAGDIYRRRRVDDPRSTDRTCS